MNRRGFLGGLLAAAAGMALDPERALWVPGRTVHFDAPQVEDGWRAFSDTTVLETLDVVAHPANALVTPEWVIREVAKLLHRNLAMAMHVHRSHDQAFRHEGAIIGDLVRAKVPVRYTR